jgi:hypothetical protein
LVLQRAGRNLFIAPPSFSAASRPPPSMPWRNKGIAPYDYCGGRIH